MPLGPGDANGPGSPYLALPAISKDLSLTSAQSLWIIDVYGFFLAGSLITMGTLGDRIGRRRSSARITISIPALVD